MWHTSAACLFPDFMPPLKYFREKKSKDYTSCTQDAYGYSSAGSAMTEVGHTSLATHSSALCVSERGFQTHTAVNTIHSSLLVSDH